MEKTGDESPRPSHARGVASRLVAGEALVVVPSRAEAHVLNEAGSLAWALMDGSRTSLDIAREIARRYSFPEEEALRDLQAFLSDLDAIGAAGPAEGPPETAAPPQEPPEPTRYEPPAVAETQAMEVVAALCSTVRGTADGTCRSLGACQKPFE